MHLRDESSKQSHLNYQLLFFLNTSYVMSWQCRLSLTIDFDTALQNSSRWRMLTSSPIPSLPAANLILASVISNNISSSLRTLSVWLSVMACTPIPVIKKRQFSDLLSVYWLRHVFWFGCSVADSRCCFRLSLNIQFTTFQFNLLINPVLSISPLQLPAYKVAH